jgi:hypothetical protein
MLPKRAHHEKHAVWWSNTEVELLSASPSTSSAYDEYVELRADVDSVSRSVRASGGVLAEDVKR